MSLCLYGKASTPNTDAMSSRQAAKFIGMSKSAYRNANGLAESPRSLGAANTQGLQSLTPAPVCASNTLGLRARNCRRFSRLIRAGVRKSGAMRVHRWRASWRICGPERGIGSMPRPGGAIVTSYRACLPDEPGSVGVVG